MALSGPGAHAQAGCGNDLCGAVVEDGSPGDDSGGGGSGGNGGGPTGYTWYDVDLGTDPNGEFCWTYEVIGYEPTPPPEEHTLGYVQERIDSFDGNGQAYDACPPAEVFDPGQAAREAWVGMDVEPAQPSVGPGSAVTGMRTFLELEGPTELANSVSTPLGTLTIEAWPEYHIDWGDGSPVTVTTSQGGPYPDGDVTHVYTEATGDTTITVTTVWQATFSVGSVTETLPTVEEVATLTLPVREVQPVRER